MFSSKHPLIRKWLFRFFGYSDFQMGISDLILVIHLSEFWSLKSESKNLHTNDPPKI